MSSGPGSEDVWLLRLAPEVVSVEQESKGLPQDFVLFKNYPNPFNPTTTIEYALSHAADDSLIIYNLLGEEVTRLITGRQNAGYHEVTWNASNVSSGIYFYRLQAIDSVQTRTMALLR